MHGGGGGGGGWQGLRSKQEECRYHSSNYCFINGPRVAVNEELHQSVLTARSLARHSRSCPQSVDFNLAQKLIIRLRRNLVSCWMCWRRRWRRRGRCSRLPAQLKHSQPALGAQHKHTPGMWQECCCVKHLCRWFILRMNNTHPPFFFISGIFKTFTPYSLTVSYVHVRPSR